MKEKVLKRLKEEKGYVSGQELSKELAVTRTAIWKYIKQLKNEGYHIESKTKKGYKLIEDQDLLSEIEIREKLKTKFIGQNIIFFDELDSTNTYLKKIAVSNPDIREGTVVFTDFQTKGRGRLGRDWYAGKGENISLSVLLKPDVKPDKAQGYSLLTGVSVAQAIEELCSVKTKIKWPNDILIEGKKICGILTEMNSEIDRINYLIIGIGINVSTVFPEKLRSIAISLDEVCGKEIKRKKIVQKVLEHLENNYIENINGITEKLINEWKKRSDTIGRKIVYEKNNKNKEAKVKDVLPGGELLVLNEDGSEVQINSGMIVYQNYYERGL